MDPSLETSFFPLSRYSKLFSRPQKSPPAVACAALALTQMGLSSDGSSQPTILARFQHLSVSYQWLLTKPHASFVHVLPDCHLY